MRKVDQRLGSCEVGGGRHQMSVIRIAARGVRNDCFRFGSEFGSVFKITAVRFGIGVSSVFQNRGSVRNLFDFVTTVFVQQRFKNNLSSSRCPFKMRILHV